MKLLKKNNSYACLKGTSLDGTKTAYKGLGNSIFKPTSRKSIYEGTITCGKYTATSITAYGYLRGNEIGNATGYRTSTQSYYPRLVSFYFNQNQSTLTFNFDEQYKPNGTETVVISLKDSTHDFPSVIFTWGSVKDGSDRFKLDLSTTSYPTLAQVKEMFKDTNTVDLYWHVTDLG